MRILPLVLAVLTLPSFASLLQAEDAPPVSSHLDDRSDTYSATTIADDTEGETALSTQPVPVGTVFRSARAGAVPVEGSVAGIDSRLVYSNTLGQHVFGPNANLRVADDIVTTAADGCQLDKFVFRVAGDKDFNDDVDWGPFSVNYALYRTCPNASLYPIPIPGTAGTADLPDEGFHEVAVTMADYVCEGGDHDGQECHPMDPLMCPSGVCIENDVPLPSSFWFSVTFSRHKAGIVVGSPALVGLSADRFDFPGFACASSFGGFPTGPHGSFYAEFYTNGECGESFAGYRNSRQAGSPYSNGAGGVFADDFTLGVPIGDGEPGCNMIGYEVSIKGARSNSSGAVQTQIHEFLGAEDPLNAGMIPGTRRTKFLFGDTLQILRGNFSTPIPVPREQLFMVFKTSSSVVGPIQTCSDAQVGSTLDVNWEFTSEGGEGEDAAWCSAELEGNCYAGMDITIFCEGSPPQGACCDSILTEDRSCAGGTYPNQPCADNDDCPCLPECEDGTCDQVTNKCVGGPDPGPLFCTVDSECACPTLTCRVFECDGGPKDEEPCVNDADCDFPQPCDRGGECVGESVCRDVPQMNCANPETWVEGEHCLPACIGGPNHGKLCGEPGHCPSVCFGGDNDGLLCTALEDCPDGVCDFGFCEGAFCSGGVNDGLPCSRATDCPGGDCEGQPFANGLACGVGACCGCIGAPCGLAPTGCLDRVTEKECFVQTPGGERLFSLGETCRNTCWWGPACLGQGACTLPRPTFCVGGDNDGQPCDPDGYTTIECPPGFPQATCPGVPGCGDPFCCTAVCDMDSFCCLSWWDEWCAATAFTVCGDGRSANVPCHDPDDPNGGALLVEVPTVREISTAYALEQPDEPGFCCKGDDPGGQGVGTTWFKFVAENPDDPDAETTSVSISTCESMEQPEGGIYYPPGDSLIQVFSVQDPDVGICANSSPCSVSAQDCLHGMTCTIDLQRACENLIPIACNDDGASCSGDGGAPHPGQSELCLPDLVVGRTYYVMVAAKAERDRGIYHVTFDHVSVCENDPNLDCDNDGMPDDCEPDADQDGIPDDCDRLGDYDHDGDIDLTDYKQFTICLDMLGPSDSPSALYCLDVFDAEPSDAIDLRDFATFQRVFTN